jgi:GDP-L-fucose synthase
MTRAGKQGVLLITGGTGMVGRNLIDHPRSGDWTIVAPSRQELDLGDASSVAAYVAGLRPDAVVHAAGLVGGIHANIANPVRFLTENVQIGQNIVLGARAAGVRIFLNLASTCMYPRNIASWISEDRILTGQLEPTNEGYALAKIVVTRLCEYIRREDRALQYKTVIPCNIYGRFDTFDPARSHLIPAVIHKIHLAKKEGRDEVEIWGDGQARREFMYVGDLAEAIFAVLADIESVPDVMNVGLGHDYSIVEYYRAVAEIVGWTGRFTHDLSRPAGMDRKLADVQRIKAWGWEASTTLREGICRTYEYYLERPER